MCDIHDMVETTGPASATGGLDQSKVAMESSAGGTGQTGTI